MALKVREIPDLMDKNKITLVAGRNGLERDIFSVGIADYEFLDGFDYSVEDEFEPDCFVISSLIFAQGHPEKILYALKILFHRGVSGRACKEALFQKLPPEAISFANANDFPIFSFRKDVHSEDFIFQITEAVLKDDHQLLSEENLELMIQKRLSNYDLQKITRGISLILKRYAMAAYITSMDSMNIGRILRSVYMSKQIRSKAIMARYGDGIFLIVTGQAKDEKQFDILMKNVLESCPIDAGKISIYQSSIHSAHEELDDCIRESYHAYTASAASGKKFENYSKIGTYSYLIPLLESTALESFSKRISDAIADKKELLETAEAFILKGGEVAAAAAECGCHLNTIRYRLGRIREITGMEEMTDFEFYEALSTAIKVRCLKDL